jgi:ribonucleotide reductase beta subunit family protein with ferritin-like domain
LTKIAREIQMCRSVFSFKENITAKEYTVIIEKIASVVELPVYHTPKRRPLT